MEKENENIFTEVGKKVSECKVDPYFIMDIASGEMTALFSCKNDETAIRSFMMNMDMLPRAIVHDAVLVHYDSREIIFEGKDYLEKWEQNQLFLSKMKGVSHAN